MSIERRAALACLALLLTLAFGGRPPCAAAGAPPAARPDVVLILAGDVGFSDLSVRIAARKRPCGFGRSVRTGRTTRGTTVKVRKP